MGRNEIIYHLHEFTSIRYGDLWIIFNAFIESMREALIRGDTVYLNNFGKFDLGKYWSKGKRGYYIRFRPFQKLREMCNLSSKTDDIILELLTNPNERESE